MPDFQKMTDDSLYRDKWGSLERVLTHTQCPYKKRQFGQRYYTELLQREDYAMTSQKATVESSPAYIRISSILASRYLRQYMAVAKNTNMDHFTTADLAKQSGGHIREMLGGYDRCLSVIVPSLGGFRDTVPIDCVPGAYLRGLLPPEGSSTPL